MPDDEIWCTEMPDDEVCPSDLAIANAKIELAVQALKRLFTAVEFNTSIGEDGRTVVSLTVTTPWAVVLEHKKEI